jgi:hypothetical protein
LVIAASNDQLKSACNAATNGLALSAKEFGCSYALRFSVAPGFNGPLRQRLRIASKGSVTMNAHKHETQETSGPADAAGKTPDDAVIMARHEDIQKKHTAIIAAHRAMVARHKAVLQSHESGKASAAEIAADYKKMNSEHHQMLSDHEQMMKEHEEMQSDHRKLTDCSVGK